MENADDKKPTFERSAETDLCLQLLIEAKPGETINWTQFEKSLLQDVESIRGNIDSARRIAFAAHNILFAAVRGVGLKRVVTGERASILSQRRERLRRAAKRGLCEGAGEDYQGLTPEQKRDLNTEMTVLGMIHYSAKPKVVNRIKNVVAKKEKRLPYGQALEAMGIKDKTETEEE